MSPRFGIVASSLAVALLLSGPANAQISPAASASLRIGTEAAFGGIGTIAGGAAGILLGFGAAKKSSCSDISGCLAITFAFVPLGIAAVVPFAVWGAGVLWGGAGELLPTLLGSTLGTASSLSLFFAAVSLFPGFDPLDHWWSLALLFVLPTLGGIIGYEVSNSLALQRAGVPAPPIAPIRFGFAWSI